MFTVSTSDIVRKPALISHPSQITLVQDARKNEPRSVVLPYALYEKLRQKIEDELYLAENAKALGVEAQAEFEQIEPVAEELIRD
ncbi:MAG: hypothetical protein AB7E49_09875 [Campylobacterales bacterium]